MKLKLGDSVVVISGSEKGKSGKITKIFKTSNKVIISGLNMRTKHQSSQIQNNASGLLIQKEQPIHISNVALSDFNDRSIK